MTPPFNNLVSRFVIQSASKLNDLIDALHVYLDILRHLSLAIYRKNCN